MHPTACVESAPIKNGTPTIMKQALQIKASGLNCGWVDQLSAKDQLLGTILFMQGVLNVSKQSPYSGGIRQI